MLHHRQVKLLLGTRYAVHLFVYEVFGPVWLSAVMLATHTVAGTGLLLVTFYFIPFGLERGMEWVGAEAKMGFGFWNIQGRRVTIFYLYTYQVMI
jgi:hypothetical protein